MKRILKLSSALMFVAALVTFASAFTTKTVAKKAVLTTQFNTYKTTAPQPPSSSSIDPASGNWNSPVNIAPPYTSGTDLFSIEYDDANTSFSDAIAILDHFLTDINNGTYGDNQQLFDPNNASKSIIIHLGN